MTYKKCTFQNLKGRKINRLGRPKTKGKAMTANQRAKALSDWKKSW